MDENFFFFNQLIICFLNKIAMDKEYKNGNYSFSMHSPRYFRAEFACVLPEYPKLLGHGNRDHATSSKRGRLERFI